MTWKTADYRSTNLYRTDNFTVPFRAIFAVVRLPV